MNQYPRHYARYQNQNWQTVDMMHYEDDKDVFLDTVNVEWRRVAVTKGLHYTLKSATAELDMLRARDDS